MTRIATIPMQRNLFEAISRAQGKLADSQLQLATNRKVKDYAGLGSEGIRNLSAHQMVAREKAHGAVTNRLQTTLAIYDSSISGIEDAADSLRTSILKAIGTGDSAGLQGAIEEAFQRFRTSLNADEGGVPLFGGAQTDGAPFQPSTLVETATVPVAAAFRNDDVKATARVADGLSITYGVTASEVGIAFYEAFSAVAQQGPIGNKPTAAQMAALNEAVGKLDDGLRTVRTVNAENGRRRAQVETLATRSEERGLLWKELISRNEDADMAQVAADISQRQTVLEASYSVFAKLSGLSLTRYL